MQLILVTDTIRLSVKEPTNLLLVDVHIERGNEFYDFKMTRDSLALLVHIAFRKALGLSIVQYVRHVEMLTRDYFPDDKLKFFPTI